LLFEDIKKNIHSQFGEDGIIEHILSILPGKDGWCCEFGAWDGKFLSNTFALVESKSYNAVYIEGDSNKYNNLLNTVSSYPNIIPINDFVGIEGQSSLDNILSRTNIPERFDVLSIDIDGYDYHVWKNLTKYKPKVVIIEVNSYFDPSADFTEEELSYTGMLNRRHDYGGVNFKACYDLGKSKGYRLFTHTGNTIGAGNMIFIDNSYENLFPNLAIDSNYLNYFYSGWCRNTRPYSE
jgi:hypothetical protein